MLICNSGATETMSLGRFRVVRKVFSAVAQCVEVLNNGCQALHGLAYGINKVSSMLNRKMRLLPQRMIVLQRWIKYVEEGSEGVMTKIFPITQRVRRLNEILQAIVQGEATLRGLTTR